MTGHCQSQLFRSVGEFLKSKWQIVGVFSIVKEGVQLTKRGGTINNHRSECTQVGGGTRWYAAGRRRALETGPQLPPRQGFPPCLLLRRASSPACCHRPRQEGGLGALLPPRLAGGRTWPLLPRIPLPSQHQAPQWRPTWVLRRESVTFTTHRETVVRKSAKADCQHCLANRFCSKVHNSYLRFSARSLCL